MAHFHVAAILHARSFNAVESTVHLFHEIFLPTQFAERVLASQSIRVLLVDLLVANLTVAFIELRQRSIHTWISLDQIWVKLETQLELQLILFVEPLLHAIT